MLAVLELMQHWMWKGSDSAAVSNTDGTITSQVSANPTAGFSVMKYTGNATAGANCRSWFIFSS